MKRIKNYKELASEQIRLEQLLAYQKLSLKNDFKAMKDSLKPMALIKDMLGIESGGNLVGPLAGAGINAGIDMVLRNTVLAKAGFIVRNVIPMALKTVVNLFSKNRNTNNTNSYGHAEHLGEKHV